MACILKRQAGIVAALFLLDTYNFAFGKFLPLPELILRNVLYYLRRTGVLARRLPSIRLSEWPEFFAKRLAILRRQAGQLAKLASGEGCTQFPIEPSDVEVTHAAGTKLGEILTRVNQASIVAASAFVPKPYGGRAVIFRASERIIEPYQDQYLGWGPVVRGGIEVCEIEGEHNSIFLDPDVKALAERLNAKLVEAYAKFSSR